MYGQTKAAGEALVATLPRHWIVRTSWVIGEGGNFVATMQRLARGGVSPNVVGDQIGRLTFARDLAAGIIHLVSNAAPGTYNLTNDGLPQSWADIARRVFELCGRPPEDVHEVTTSDYNPGRLTAHGHSTACWTSPGSRRPGSSRRMRRPASSNTCLRSTRPEPSGAGWIRRCEPGRWTS
ncbi:SDR family oxidoreductase [Tessaracoccus coleopterorum]|uniref:SDR family oxidoreductase n=1 Tax=Tessaracoccus coleopterorum TaxID=2714950 RepID=UPI002F90BE52